MSYAYVNDILEVTITNKRELLLNELPSGIKLMCKLKRRKSLMSFIAPEFDLYLESGFKHLMSAQKQVMSQARVFKLSMDVGEYSSEGVLCNLETNSLHNHYLLVGERQNTKLPYYFVHG